MCNLPTDRLSERELAVLRLSACNAMNNMERLELLDFLGYPDPMPTHPVDRVEAVVNRILAARAHGNHID